MPEEWNERKSGSVFSFGLPGQAETSQADATNKLGRVDRSSEQCEGTPHTGKSEGTGPHENAHWRTGCELRAASTGR